MDDFKRHRLAGRSILLIVGGGIAAYKSLELVRRLKDRGARVRCVLTEAGALFVTPLSLAALSGETVHQDLFSLTGESEMGHIRLSREADLIVVAPATANLLARMAAGIADDLASTVLLATDAPVLAAPAMNVKMWEHPATRRNVATLREDGIRIVGPATGELADGERGPGRLVEPEQLVAAIAEMLDSAGRATLAGLTALVTSGPTREAIDPVRFLGNVSSGKQGHAIAAALARRGASVVLVTGPTAEADPAGVRAHRVESAQEMLAACEAALPVDVAVCAAAVADWRIDRTAAQKLKKGAPTDGANRLPRLELVENPDILATLSRPGPSRPRLVVGFAAETENLIENASRKLAAKGCDWMVANDVSSATGTFGGDTNRVHLLTGGEPPVVEGWPLLSKTDVAQRLSARIADALTATGGA